MGLLELGRSLTDAPFEFPDEFVKPSRGFPRDRMGGEWRSDRFEGTEELARCDRPREATSIVNNAQKVEIVLAN